MLIVMMMNVDRDDDDDDDNDDNLTSRVRFLKVDHVLRKGRVSSSILANRTSYVQLIIICSKALL
jgi:hypothetical protein